METNIISVKYEERYEPKIFGGKAYNYYTNIDVNIGDLVIAPTSCGVKVARVSEINIPETKVEDIKQELKIIMGKINKERYLKTSQILKEAA